MLIFDAGLEEETIRAAIDRFAEFIRSRGGNPGRVDRWGKRRFAYELRPPMGRATTSSWSSPAEVELEQELHRMLSLADEVVRHKVVRIPPEAALQGPGGARSRRGIVKEGRQKMSRTTASTIVGNITADPELRFTPSGQANARLGVAVNRRWQDPATAGEWQEATSFFDCDLPGGSWPEKRERVAQSAGARVIVTGPPRAAHLGAGGEQAAAVVEIIADEVAPSLRWATPRSRRPRPRSGGGPGEGVGGGSGFGPPRAGRRGSPRRTTTSATSRSNP